MLAEWVHLQMVHDCYTTPRHHNMPMKASWSTCTDVKLWVKQTICGTFWYVCSKFSIDTTARQLSSRKQPNVLFNHRSLTQSPYREESWSSSSSPGYQSIVLLEVRKRQTLCTHKYEHCTSSNFIHFGCNSDIWVWNLIWLRFSILSLSPPLLWFECFNLVPESEIKLGSLCSSRANSI